MMTLRTALIVVAAALAGPAIAEDNSGGKGPDITDLCEKEKVQVCEWQGSQKVCKWVDGDKCAVYMQQPRAGMFRPGGVMQKFQQR